MCGLASSQEKPSATLERNLQAEDSLYGLVVDIDSSGNLVMGSGERIDIWGLTDIDVSKANTVIVGNYVFCRIVNEQDQIHVGDCSMVPSGLRTVEPEGSLALYHWLPHFGIARQACSSRDSVPGVLGIFHVSEYYYQCKAGTVPVRSRVTE